MIWVDIPCHAHHDVADNDFYGCTRNRLNTRKPHLFGRGLLKAQSIPKPRPSAASRRAARDQVQPRAQWLTYWPLAKGFPKPAEPCRHPTNLAVHAATAPASL
jgi:hypothetical protein